MGKQQACVWKEDREEAKKKKAGCNLLLTRVI